LKCGLLLIKKVLIVCFLTLFLVLPCRLASADPVYVELLSPRPGVVYFQQVSVGLLVGYDYSQIKAAIIAFSYSVDGQPYQSYSGGSSSCTLTDLSQGEHTVQIKCTVNWGYTTAHPGAGIKEFDSGIISFFINRGIGGPDVSILCSDNYVTNQVPLSIMTNTSRAQVSYSLDGQPKVNLPTQYALSFPVTLSNLTDGSHTIAAYATDFLGNTQTTQKNFTINAQNTTDTDNTSQTPPQIHPSPITNLAIIIGAAITTVILATAIVTVMNFRHKSNKVEKPAEVAVPP
jgi:hypothetical protein